MEKSGGALPDLKEALSAAGAVKPEDLQWALQEHEKNKKSHFLDILLDAGKCDEKMLTQIFSTQYGFRLVSLKMLAISSEVLKLIPKAFAEARCCIPISILEETLVVAFANPTNLKILDEIQTSTGKRVRAAVAEYSLLKEKIKTAYEKESSETAAAEDGTEEFGMLAKLVRTDVVPGRQEKVSDLMGMANQVPVVKLVNMILVEGVRRRASDIFIEPWETFVRVRVRVDGVLEEIVKPQKSFGAAIVSRIKIMSQLNIAEHRIPQDGRFKVRMQDREVDMRVSVLPSSFGEKVCLRILNTDVQAHDLSKLGFTEREQQIIRDCAQKPHGMLLVTGPTGSGKTTTLYSILQYLDSPKVNITTVEDPVEYQITGINQVNVRESIGLTFPAALRSILRQDPDIVLIGEIRDAETLDIAVKAALTGHLVLSTLHTNDAVSSITRMANLGLEPFLIASTVLMISAQRLVRRLCSHCRVAYEPDPTILKLAGLDPQKKMTFWKPKGCSHCRKLGYQGRSVITEILQMTPKILEMIMQSASIDALVQQARDNGMNTLRESAMQKAMTGETSLEEVFRVTTENQTVKKSGDARQ